MQKLVLKAYHRLPPFARDIAASMRGRQLRQWRYGPETDTLTSQARERETWSKKQWHDWQAPRLAALLKRACESVPYYREDWGQRGKRNGSQEVPALQIWPVLAKEQMRRNPRAFVADGTSINRLSAEHTSGTTGTPLQLWHGRETARSWYALMEARWRGWHGVSRADHWAILGGQLVTPSAQTRPPFWVWNAGLKQLYLSSYHLSAANCASYLEALGEFQVAYIYGYASSLYSLAVLAEAEGLKPPPLKVAISNAESLYTHQRETIARAFGCPVRDTYGMSEMVCAASECDAGRMHLWPEAGVYEVLQDDCDQPAAPGEIGRLVCTGLLNPDMPLVRYEVGDRVSIAPADEKCSCGRTLPVLLSVDGRSDDVIVTPDGRRIGRLDPVFKSDIPIREAQIVQESAEVVRLLVVPGRGFNAAHEEALVAALRERVGEMQIQVEKVTAIPRTANGKFRAVLSKVSSVPRTYG